jgi:hypothetical protein
VNLGVRVTIAPIERDLRPGAAPFAARKVLPNETDLGFENGAMGE